MPLLIALLALQQLADILVPAGSLLCLAALGAIGAAIGGAGLLRPTLRVTFWGAFAMAATALIGAAAGHAV